MGLGDWLSERKDEFLTGLNYLTHRSPSPEGVSATFNELFNPQSYLNPDVVGLPVKPLPPPNLPVTPAAASLSAEQKYTMANTNVDDRFHNLMVHQGLTPEQTQQLRSQYDMQKASGKVGSKPFDQAEGEFWNTILAQADQMAQGNIQEKQIRQEAEQSAAVKNEQQAARRQQGFENVLALQAQAAEYMKPYADQLAALGPAFGQAFQAIQGNNSPQYNQLGSFLSQAAAPYMQDKAAQLMSGATSIVPGVYQQLLGQSITAEDEARMKQLAAAENRLSDLDAEIAKKKKEQQGS